MALPGQQMVLPPTRLPDLCTCSHCRPSPPSPQPHPPHPRQEGQQTCREPRCRGPTCRRPRWAGTQVQWNILEAARTLLSLPLRGARSLTRASAEGPGEKRGPRGDAQLPPRVPQTPTLPPQVRHLWREASLPHPVTEPTTVPGSWPGPCRAGPSDGTCQSPRAGGSSSQAPRRRQRFLEDPKPSCLTRPLRDQAPGSHQLVCDAAGTQPAPGTRSHSPLHPSTAGLPAPGPPREHFGEEAWGVAWMRAGRQGSAPLFPAPAPLWL